MRKNFYLIISVGILLSMFGSTGVAIVLTSRSQMNAQATTIDFEDFSTANGLIADPFVKDGVTFTSTGNLGTHVLGGAGRTLVSVPGSGTTAGSVDMSITFSQAVSEVGLDFIDPQFVGTEMRVFNSSNQLLESAAIPFVASGNNTEFRGIQRSTNEISRVDLVFTPSNDAVFMNDLVFFQTGVVPEPNVFFLFTIAFGTFIGRFCLRK